MLEKEIEQYLCDRVRELGGEVRKIRFIGRNGAPDRLVMLPERTKPASCWCCPPIQIASQAVWIELKAPGIKAKPHQIREHERMRRMGQRVEVVDSIERVDEVLR